MCARRPDQGLPEAHALLRLLAGAVLRTGGWASGWIASRLLDHIVTDDHAMAVPVPHRVCDKTADPD
ncbi:hypothetical protein AB0M87_06565 [Streptomyces sp. NPDC051320]|uniref:hypothetical protein n=1 Tax=Streptomyces sp. NPDC051320 TaxID=3154644 RepID=UPI003442DC19